MTTAPESSPVKRALSAHAAIGLLVGGLLYLVSLSGTVAVFHEEFQRIEQPDAPEMDSIAPEAVQRGIEAVLASDDGKPVTTHLTVRLPVETRPRTTISSDYRSVHVDAAGVIAGREENAWSRFLVALHYTLNLPILLGVTIVGGLGVMMLALCVSGVVALPRIFRDAFRLRARNKAGVALADWHNRLSVWTLPFTLAIALTGAVLGMAGLIYSAMAANSYDGDIEAVYAPIYGEEGEADDTPAPVPNVVAALEYMQTNYPDVTLTYIVLHDPLTKGQHVQIIGLPDRRLIIGEYYAFDGDGQFHGTVGLADGDIGQQAAASSYDLHFGNFGGLPVKLAYLFFGFILTVICATGCYIWLGKRQRRGIEEPRLRAAWDAVVWGSPLALTSTFILRMLMGNDAPLAAAFWLGLAAIIIASIFISAPGRLARILKRALAVACAAGSLFVLSGCIEIATR